MADFLWRRVGPVVPFAAVLALVMYQLAQAFPVCVPLPIPCIESDGGFVISEEAGKLISGFFMAVLGFFGDVVRGFTDVVMGWVVDALPDADPLGAPSLDGILVGYVWANGFLPLDAGLAVSGMLVTAMVAKFGLRLSITIWHLVPKPFMGT